MNQETIRLQDVKRLLRSAEDLELSSGAVRRLKWFLFAAEHDGNVSLTCRHFGIARSTFLRWAERFSSADIATLEENSRRPMKVRSSVIDPKIIEIIRALREASPKLGKEIIAEKLLSEHGVTLSASTVGRIITRHKLFFGETKSHAEKRASTNINTDSVSDNEMLPTSLAPLSGTNEVGDIDDPYTLLPASGFTS